MAENDGGAVTDSRSLDDNAISQDELEELLGGGGGGGDEDEDEADEKDDKGGKDDPDEDEDEDEEGDEEDGEAEDADPDEEEDEDEEDGEAEDEDEPKPFSKARERASLDSDVAELKELMVGMREDLTTLRAAREDDAPDPAVVEATEELKDAQARLQSVVTAQKEQLKTIDTRKESVHRLEGELAATPKADRAGVQSRLTSAIESYNSAVEKYRDKQEKLSELERTVRKQVSAVEALQAQVKDRTRQARALQQQQADRQKETGKQFTGLVDRAFKALKLSKREYRDFYDVVSRDVSSTLRDLINRSSRSGAEAKEVTLASLVAQASARVARLKGIQVKSSQLALDGKHKRRSLKSLGRDTAIRGRRRAAPEPSSGGRPRKSDAFSKLSPAEQAVYAQRRARYVVQHGHAPGRKRSGRS